MNDLQKTVRELCVKKLARILYDCVDGPAERALLDWKTAEENIDQDLVKTAVNRLARNILLGREINTFIQTGNLSVNIDLSQQDLAQRFEESCGRLIWDRYQCTKPHLPEQYGRIRLE